MLEVASRSFARVALDGRPIASRVPLRDSLEGPTECTRQMRCRGRDEKKKGGETMGRDAMQEDAKVGAVGWVRLKNQLRLGKIKSGKW